MDSEGFDSTDPEPEAYGTDDESSDEETRRHFASSGSQVCKFCENLLLAVMKGDRSAVSYRSPDHFESFYTMKQSAQTCGLCWTLIEATEDHLTFSPDVLFPWDRNMQLGSYEIYAASFVKNFCSEQTLREADIHEFTLAMGYEEDMPRLRFLIMANAGSGAISQRAIWSSRIPMQLGSRLPVVYEWLNSCSTNHTRCRQRLANPARTLPTRLVDLFDSSHTGSFNPRLVNTADLDRDNLQYTTLSHRWGKVQPVRTLTENMDDFADSIFPLASRSKRRIPKTFSDAMKITRALGLRYIWIDSLCIIQDNRSDWEREAARMADVYAGSYLNIASIDGAGCDSGCGLDIPCKVISLSSPRMDGVTIKVRGLPADPAHVFASQLNARGWVFQELMLAPRVLYCGRDQFFWQCVEKSYSEDGYIDHDVALHIPREHEHESTTYDWAHQVRDFSQRKFTITSDRLPAFYGVVSRYQQEKGHTPVLGMWKETLIDDLAWRTRQVYYNPAHSYPPERSDLANMPTWSWLSLHSHEYPNGVLYFSALEERTVLAHIDDVQVSWEGKPHFSSISSTRLIITGPLQKFSLQYDAGRRRLHKEGDEANPHTDTFVIRLDEALKDCLNWGDIGEFWCLQLDKGHFRERSVATFLVIEELDRRAGIRAFRRLGCGRMPVNHVNFSKPVIERLELV